MNVGLLRFSDLPCDIQIQKIMKKTLIILVLFLLGFSNSSFADKLPTSLFGISMFEPIDQYVIKDDLTKSYDDCD